MARKGKPKNDWKKIVDDLQAQPPGDEKRTRTQAWLMVPENIERLLEAVSCGLSVRRFCEHEDITYSPVQRYLTATDEMRARYYSAQEDQAEHLLGEMERITQAIEHGSIDPKQGSVILDSIKWRLSKFNARRYSDRQVIEQHTFDHTKAHIEAVRQLARRGATIDGQLAGPAAQALAGPTRALVFSRDTQVDTGSSQELPGNTSNVPVSHKRSQEIPVVMVDTGDTGSDK